MKYISYINFPQVPQDLLPAVQDIINSPPKPNSNIPPEYYCYQSRLASFNLEEFLRKIIPFDCLIQYQIIRRGIPIHKDAKGRKVAINYLLSTGGNDVATTVYDEDQSTILQKEVIKPNCWHYLTTDRFHGINGNSFDSDRVAISVTPVDQDSFLASYGLTANPNTSLKEGDLS